MMRSFNIKYYSGGESDGADAEYIYVNHIVDPYIEGNENIKIKEYHMEHENKETPVSYKIITNNETDVNKEYAQYRSVIFASPENTVLSFSPPVGIPIEEFREKYPVINDDIYVNECIEGTMVQLFYDERINKWELATKNAIGANYWYYRTQYAVDTTAKEQLTFRRMFLDAFRAGEEDDINTLPFIEYFPKEYSYTFVLRHPENHIVQYVENPVVYLVAVYHMCDNRAIYIPPIIYEEWDCFFNIRGLLEFPSFYDCTNYDGFVFQNAYSMGYMLTNIRTGDRSHIENPYYNYLRELRSNHPNMQYLFYQLRANGRINEFLYYFPHYLQLFTQFHLQYQEFLSKIHGLYVANYIQRTGVKCPAKYFSIIYKLHHEVFIPSIAAGSKIVIRKSVVDQYLSHLSPGSLLFYLTPINTEDIIPVKI